jgi:hypothetical protein
MRKQSLRAGDGMSFSLKKKLDKKRRVSAKRASSATYCIEMLNWDLSYSFSLDRHRKFSIGPYWEHTSLEMNGNFLYPETLASRTIQITFLGDREEVQALEHPEECRYEPKAVGGLTVRGKQSEFIGSVPSDALQTFCLLLQAGKIKYLVLSGQSLYRGDADITSIRLQEHFGPEDIG